MLAVIVLTTLFGLWKGMAWQLASLGLPGAQLDRGHAVQRPAWLPTSASHEPWNRFIAMLVLFLATSLAVWLVFRLVAGVIDRVRLKEFDRQMGALFGLAKGCLLCLVITFFAVTLSETARQAVLKSKSGKYIAVAIQKATPAMPQEVRDVLGKYIDELDQKLDPNTPSNGPPSQRTAAGTDLPPAPTSRWPNRSRPISATASQAGSTSTSRRGLDGLDQQWDSLKSRVQSTVDQGLNASTGK